MAEISVIIPVYMVEDYLEQCLDSVLNQTFSDLEIILVIAYGKDRSEEICDSYAKKDSRIKMIKTEPLGNSDARNRGVEAATGKYIGFVDADDWVELDMFATLHSQLIENDADMSACGFSLSYANATKTFPDDRDTMVLTREKAMEYFVFDKNFYGVLWNKLYKKELFRDVVFPVGKHYEDVAGIYRLIYNTEKVVFSPVVKYHYRQRGVSQVRSHNMDRKFDLVDATIEMKQFFKEHLPEIIDVAEFKYVDALITILHISCQSNYKNQRILKCRKEIWQYGKHFLSDKRVPLEIRMRIVLSRFGYNIYRIVYLTALKKYRNKFIFYK